MVLGSDRLAWISKATVGQSTSPNGCEPTGGEGYAADACRDPRHRAPVGHTLDWTQPRADLRAPDTAPERAYSGLRLVNFPPHVLVLGLHPASSDQLNDPINSSAAPAAIDLRLGQIDPPSSVADPRGRAVPVSRRSLPQRGRRLRQRGVPKLLSRSLSPIGPRDALAGGT